MGAQAGVGESVNINDLYDGFQWFHEFQKFQSFKMFKLFKSSDSEKLPYRNGFAAARQESA
jgi:hypothetical protein